ncbi:PatB family C-S lyase [Halomonas sp. KAO]|uniref:MalY/PatB family protein n=1 Tax=unclassified Halomonas TaxID=2609666 RepID=UPI00189F7FA1|nr:MULTISPECIES: PatB family C-S lyase [unclassified Halomonas]MBF7052186.1 PatB family C-S lyase [Halomonas sp. KAO]MDT0501685.1 PatB family C-S lyase [Halomonas sp. PAR7]MDT0512053.1 PatB family C-S lyase [Halomonas sp. LES1]MDT0590810.1 PatB family C-S lyase [Halomonas sp. PAR8]
MGFDFATPVERRHPSGNWPSQKWHRHGEQVLPLWVADMDFVSPPAVIEALRARVDHGVYGYGLVPDSLRETLCAWSSAHYGWTIAPEWQHWLPGVVPALHLASLALTEPGDGVLTVTPIYPPFLKVAEHTGRLPQQATMREPSSPGESWRLDLEALEAAITPRTRLLLWCHPHNPTGRVWRHEELAGLAELVERHDLHVVSDELHCDLLLEAGACHQPLAAAFPALAARTITLWAPSKTFNLAGLTAACAVIPDSRLRQRFAAAARGMMPDGNVLGLVAAEAAYARGEPWRQALLEVLRGHRQMLTERVAHWPGVGMAPPQSTYLAWLDLRQAGLGESPQRALLERAGVALSDGADFGWPGFVRLNFGTTATQLEAALSRLDRVLKG